MRTVTRLFHVSLRKFDLFELDVGLPFVHCHSNHCTKGSTWWSISGRPCGVAPAAAFFSGITLAFWNLSTYIEGTESSLTSLTGNTRWSAWRFNMIQRVMCDKNCICCVAEVCCDQRAHLDNWPRSSTVTITHHPSTCDDMNPKRNMILKQLIGDTATVRSNACFCSCLSVLFLLPISVLVVLVNPWWCAGTRTGRRAEVDYLTRLRLIV